MSEPINEPPRKERRVFNEPGHAHYLTYSCFQGLPLLSKDNPRNWVIEAIETARWRHEMAIFAYVIMPEHMHVLAWPRLKEYSIERFLYDLKHPVSVKAKKFLREQGHTQWLSRLTVKHGQRMTFHLWQAGGGFDRNLVRPDSLWPVIEYIHANPVRRKLVERPTDWAWSSARFWAGHEGVLLKMDPIDV